MLGKIINWIKSSFIHEKPVAEIAKEYNRGYEHKYKRSYQRRSAGRSAISTTTSHGGHRPPNRSNQYRHENPRRGRPVGRLESD